MTAQKTPVKESLSWTISFMAPVSCVITQGLRHDTGNGGVIIVRNVIQLEIYNAMDSEENKF